MIKNKIVILFILCSLISCIKQSPQLPANKGNTVNEKTANLLLINQKMTIKEDSILQLFAEKDTAFKKSELGFWYKINQKTNGAIIKDKDNCRFSYQMMFLDGKVVEKGEKNIVIGQKQIVIGLEEGIKLIRKGESATFIVPWYLGYGISGNKQLVPPYKSIIYRIKVYE